MVFYRALLRGQCSGQEIQQGLVYASLEPWTDSWKEAVQDAVGYQLRQEWQGIALPLLSQEYRFTSVYVDGINERGEVIGDYPSVFPLDEPGLVAGDLDGADTYAVVNLQCTAIADQPTWRVPKRSYIAFGPLTSGQVNNSALVTLNPTLQNNLLVYLTGEMITTEGTLYPWRVTQTKAPLAPGAALVRRAYVSPYKGTRQSRRRRPSG